MKQSKYSLQTTFLRKNFVRRSYWWPTIGFDLWVNEVNLPFKYMILERKQFMEHITNPSQVSWQVIVGDTKETTYLDIDAEMTWKMSLPFLEI